MKLFRKQPHTTRRLRVREGICLFAILVITGCTGGGDSFGFLENSQLTGTGNASISIVAAIPSTTDVTLKETNTSDSFSVTAVGTGALSYQWTIDNAPAPSGTSAVFNFNASSQTIGIKVLKVTVTDERGTATRSWNVKVNDRPVFGSPSPLQTTFKMAINETQAFTATATDGNAAETLTYYWTLDGASVGTATNSYTYAPVDVNVGTHTLVLNVRDGALSDTGTWVETQTWTIEANFFYPGCNTMDNEAWFANSTTNPKGYNRTCVYGGNASIGDGTKPSELPGGFKIYPTALSFTSDGNLFVADEANDVVWFWNRSASDVTIVGKTIGAGKMEIVVGNGISAATGNNRFGREGSLDNPRGVAWDGTNLLISEWSGNRIRRLGPTGPSGKYVLSTITITCDNPNGIEYTSTGTTPGFYVACARDHANGNRIRRIETAGWTNSSVIGTGANTSTGDGGVATAATIQQPRDLSFDDDGNLYFVESGSCKLRVVNRKTTTINLLSGGQQVSIAAGNVGSLVSAAGCATASNNNTLGVGGTAGFNFPIALAVNATVNAGTGRVNGYIYVVTWGDNSHGRRIIYLNLNDTITPSIGATTVNALSARRLIGTGTAGFLDANDAINGLFNNIMDVAIHPTDDSVYIADYDNRRVRRAHPTSNDLTTLIGSGVTARNGTAGNGSEYTTADLFNAPRFISYSVADGIAFVSDSTNNRIRAISKHGINTNAIGSGTAGAPTGEDETPANVNMNVPGQSALIGATSTFGGHLIYADTTNHCIRMWNRSTSPITTYFNVTIPANRVRTIVGICGTSGNLTAGQATSAAALSSPLGVAVEDTHLYISDTTNNCIKKIEITGASAGVISAAAGNCGGAGAFADGSPIAIARLNAPAGLAYMHYINPSNATQFTKGILVADTTNHRIRLLKLSGTGPFSGQTVTTGNLDTVAGMGGAGDHDEGNSASSIRLLNPYGVTAVGSRRFCFTNSGYHNARCVDGFTTIASTAIGAPQGTGAATTYFFGRAPMGPTDQNNVIGYIDGNYTVDNLYGTDWTPLAAPSGPGTTAPFEPFGTLVSPWGIATIDTNSILVVETAGGHTIRKVRLAPP